MKNKKSIAMAMATVSTLGAVAPTFTTVVSAAEITGNIEKYFNLDNLRSENDQIRVQAEKDLEVTVAAIEELVAEVDVNGNKVYKVETEEAVQVVDGVRQTYIYVTLTSQDDVNNVKEENFTFFRTMVDSGFGQDVIAQTVDVNIDKKSDRTKLSKMIYEMNKNLDKITVVYDKEKNDKLITVYAGKVGLDEIEAGSIELVELAYINLFGNLDKLSKVVLVNANNDFLGHWAEDTIVDAMIAGIVDNTEKFNPEQEITRAQFAKMICEANKIPVPEYTQDNKELFEKFTDVKLTEWYAGYVAAIAEKGLMNGDGNKTFRPEDKISRQEVAVVLATLKKNTIVDGKYVGVETVTTDVNGNRVHKDTKTNFVDDANIAIWADESVEELRMAEIAKGYEVSKGKFEYRPVNNMSRAEALTMITRVSK